MIFTIKGKQVIKAIFLSALLVASACKKNSNADDNNSDANSTNVSVDPVEASIESGVTLISGIADDQTSVTYAVRSESPRANIWETLLLQKAVADNCYRAYQASCVNGVKTASLSSCVPSGTSRSVSGSITLSYSHMSCTLATDGDSVVRTYDLNIEGPRGGLFSHSSTLFTDYRGTSYGGGGKLTKTTAGWDMEVLGRHSSLTIRDRKVIDVSVRTLAPIGMTGSLSRAGRTINGGQIEVNHNLAKFTAVIAPSNLQWSANCCHPTSGTLSVSYSGAKSGTATVSFQGCGSANVVQGGQSSAIALSYCE